MPLPGDVQGDYGPVVVIAGKFKGRVGDYDDDDGKTACVCFGHPLFSGGAVRIQRRYLKKPSISDLLERHEQIQDLLVKDNFNVIYVPEDTQIELLHELNYVMAEIFDRIYVGVHGKHKGRSKKIFLSHSNKDKGFVRRAHDDLKALGHSPWIDDVKIKAGQIISREIEQGLAKADYVIVFLSENSITSKWVRVEWETKLPDEIALGRVRVIPALIDHVSMDSIPPLLRGKKYADFRDGYDRGLASILNAIGHKPYRAR